MKRKLSSSTFGVFAIIAFFLPWFETCNRVESGFEITMLDVVKNFSLGTLFTLNMGIVLLAVPLFVCLLKWLSGPTKTLPKWVNITAIILAFLNLIDVLGWLIQGIVMIFTEEKMPPLQRTQLLIITPLNIIGVILVTKLIINWIKTKLLDLKWTSPSLIFPLFSVVGFGFIVGNPYYGFLIYSISILALFAVDLEFTSKIPER